MTAGKMFLSSIMGAKNKVSRSRSNSSSSNEVKQKLSSSFRDRGGTFSAITNMLSSPIDLVKSKDELKEVKFSWRIKNFSKKISMCSDTGLNSKQIKIKLNNFTTTWNASIRFWTNDKGERVKNPVIFCCNLVSVSGDHIDNTNNDVGLSFNLSVRNKNMATLHSDLILNQDDSLRSIATTNVSMSSDFLEKNGDIVFNVRLSFHTTAVGPKEPYLCDISLKPDLLLICGSKQFHAHKEKLSEASPVFGNLIFKSQEDDEVDSNNNIGGNIKTKLDRVFVDDLSENILEKILIFVYTGKLEINDDFGRILKAADFYKIASLKSEIETRMIKLLAPDKVSSFLLLADLTNSQTLKQSALKYCKLYKEYIFKDETWQKIECEKPDLYDEALVLVSPIVCSGSDHVECVRNSNRYRDLVCRYGEHNNSTNSVLASSQPL